MSRLGAVAVVVFGSLSLACGGEDPPETTPEGSEATDNPDDAAPVDPEWALDFEITGRAVPMTARAELQVTEGDPLVHVAITGRASSTDLVMIDLTFEGIEDALGPHHVEFRLPERGEHVAISSLDDTWYFSRGGALDITVGADGSIAGSFDIALARGTLSVPGEAAMPAAVDVEDPLVGVFSGDWVLNCHSRLSGHGTVIAGGDYCDGLEF